ncbi:MAG: UDP-N-acetylmuramate--L-alanine ligase, partial [Actinomycetota bacterium]
MKFVDLGRRRRLHVIGVGGPGMSAIAIVLAEMGHDVSGSDVRETPALQTVRRSGVRVTIGHDPSVVADREVVTYSSAIPASNVELSAARSSGSTVLPRAEMLASICACTSAVGVAGTHGKTTTSSLLRAMYSSGGTDVSFIIGGDVRDVGAGAAWTGSDRLVVEADESDGTHLQLPLDAAIVTNVDVDHLDHFTTFDNIVASFGDFVDRVDGPTVLCADDPALKRMLRPSSISYGSSEADVVWSDVEFHPGRTSFSIRSEF